MIHFLNGIAQKNKGPLGGVGSSLPIDFEDIPRKFHDDRFARLTPFGTFSQFFAIWGDGKFTIGKATASA